MINTPSLVRRVAARHRSRIMRHGAEPTPDLARLILRLRTHVETVGTPETRLQIAVWARFVLLGAPDTEMQDVLAALAWIAEVVEGGVPVP